MPELRGFRGPTLEEARWLLVREGRFAGRHRHTLIPFDDATAGSGHVWVPYEREVVRSAPDVKSGSQPRERDEAAFRAHYQMQGSVA